MHLEYSSLLDAGGDELQARYTKDQNPLSRILATPMRLSLTVGPHDQTLF